MRFEHLFCPDSSQSEKEYDLTEFLTRMIGYETELKNWNQWNDSNDTVKKRILTLPCSKFHENGKIGPLKATFISNNTKYFNFLVVCRAFIISHLCGDVNSASIMSTNGWQRSAACNNLDELCKDVFCTGLKLSLKFVCPDNITADWSVQDAKKQMEFHYIKASDVASVTEMGSLVFFLEEELSFDPITVFRYKNHSFDIEDFGYRLTELENKFKTSIDLTNMEDKVLSKISSNNNQDSTDSDITPVPMTRSPANQTTIDNAHQECIVKLYQKLAETGDAKYLDLIQKLKTM